MRRHLMIRDMGLWVLALLALLLVRAAWCDSGGDDDSAQQGAALGAADDDSDGADPLAALDPEGSEAAGEGLTLGEDLPPDPHSRIDWSTYAGYLLALVALVVGILVKALRAGVLDTYLAAKGWKKYKPLLAGGLGAVLAIVGVLVLRETNVYALAEAGVAGFVAGLGATGAHQALAGGKSGADP